MSIIEIDCAPCGPRPDTYFPQIIEGTGLSSDDFDIVSRLFGCWTFQVHTDKDNIYQQNIKLISTRMTQLYQSGDIRYGSW